MFLIVALNLLAGITLTQNYALTPLSVTAFQDFTNWTEDTGATINTQTSTEFSVDNNVSQAIILRSPAFSPVVTNSYGYNYRLTVSISITGGAGDVTVQSRMYLGGAGLVYSNSHVIATGASGSYDFDFDATGITFDKIEIFGTPSDASVYTQDYTDVTFGTTDNFDDFDTGDRILSYWDGAAFVVKREDNPGGALTTITDGPILSGLVRSQVTGIVNIPVFIFGVPFVSTLWKSSYQYCDSGDLNQFQFTFISPSLFPYLTQYVTTDAAECSITPIVCDVHFTTVPVIVGATDAYTSDGTVQLAAAGSHGGVRYSTDSPTTTAGQFANVVNSSGSFTGLAAGTYTYYAVDQYNCYAVITVIIPVLTSFDYAPKYRLQYYDVETNTQSIADIEERNYSGDVIYAQGTGDPIMISKNNGEMNNKFDLIRPTFAEFNLNSERHFQYLGLFSQDDRKYKLSYTHGSVSWTGFITPSTFTETYSPTKNYPINLKFADLLASLSDYNFSDDSGNAINNDHTVLDLISIILKKLTLNLDIVSGVNKFSSGMNTTVADDPLDQAYIDALTFYDDEGAPQKCDEVLKSLLKPFGAFIIQDDSAWHILETDSQTAPYAYRRFDYKGVYQSNGTVNPVIKIDRPYVNLENVLFTNSDHTLEILPAYGKITINHPLKTRTSIFPLSMATGWQTNSYGSSAFSAPYDKAESNNKGMEFFNLTNDRLTFLSPLFSLTTFNDSLKLSLSYLIKMARYGSFYDPFTTITFNGLNVPDPPWVRLGWRLVLNYNSTDYYFHEDIGWNRIDVIATSVTSVTIPATHPTSKSLTIDTGLTLSAGKVLKIQYDATNYFRATVTSYDTTTGALVVDSYANVGSGAHSAWDIYAAGFDTNYIYSTDYNHDFQTFDKSIDLPNFTAATEVSLQLQIIFQGDQYLDFTDLTTLRAIPTSIYPEGTQISGVDPANSYYLRWYKLRAGTDADNGTSIIRGDDFNTNSNAVVWDSDGFDAFKYVNLINSIKLQDVTAKIFPNRQSPPENETLTYNGNSNYKEKLEYEITIGDLPSELVNKEIYLGVYKLSDGTPTSGWVRNDTAEAGSLQALLLTAIANQYSIPTWRLSGSFLAPNIRFKDIIKHTVTTQSFAITNPENPNGTGWSQSGSGQAWAGTSGYCYVNFDGTHTGNSTYVKQTQELLPGSRIRIDFSVQRLSTSGARVDRFVCVLFSGANVVQKVTLSDGITGDSLTTIALRFNVDGAADAIGFFIENISGTGICEYRVDYFRGSSVATVRYYYSNHLSRNDRHNLYRAELVQLIPAVTSSDITIDDTGEGNTG